MSCDPREVVLSSCRWACYPPMQHAYIQDELLCQILDGILDGGGGSGSSETNIIEVGGIPQTGADWTILLQNLGDGDFAKLLARRLLDSEEMRTDLEPTNTDLYLGKAPDSSLTSAAVWDVARVYLSATKNPTRIRYRANIIWDDRLLGW